MTSNLHSVAEEACRTLGFKIIGFQAAGAFKETYRAETPEGQIVALKVIDRSRADFVRTEREIAALKRCTSTRIARLLDYKAFRANNGCEYDVCVEEFLGGGTLEDRLAERLFTPFEVRSLLLELVQAIAVLREHRLVHRDIKPANIMFRHDSEIPILVDFGLVRDLSQHSLTMSWLPQGPGTPYFSSPEQLNNEKQSIDWRTDQFSVGVVGSIALTARHPYEAEGMTPPQVVAATASRKGPSGEFRKQMEMQGLAALVKMVRPWPVQRFSVHQELITALED